MLASGLLALLARCVSCGGVAAATGSTSTSSSGSSSIAAPSHSHVCDPGHGCTVCAACCRTYIPRGDPCDECVRQQCTAAQNPPKAVHKAPPPPLVRSAAAVQATERDALRCLLGILSVAVGGKGAGTCQDVGVSSVLVFALVGVGIVSVYSSVQVNIQFLCAWGGTFACCRLRRRMILVTNMALAGRYAEPPGAAGHRGLDRPRAGARPFQARVACIGSLVREPTCCLYGKSAHTRCSRARVETLV
jgi:hypothetical protein